MILRVLAIIGLCNAFASLAAATGPPAATAPRSLTAIRTDVSEALKAEATSRPKGDNTPQVMRLVDLYLEMAADPRRDTSLLIADLGQQVRIRLQTIRERVERRTTDKTSATEKKTTRPKRVEAKAEEAVLAQQAPPAAGAGGQQGAAGQGAAAAATPTIAARPTNFGTELVELIEAVVSPATWKINGGKGAVVYYSSKHVLVVAAPDDVHGQVSGVLQQLHDAQRRQDGTQVVSEIGVAQGKQ